ncbi:hypothetical protein FGIG_01622 [Fasciola gigantica]|uniref:Uncharacterized protein n=1 Tax=Fasciola gigantica TaxID=46835 RepID=A0A504YKX8_FASGI|nr:hypothetical protein FGIG_01622 [Fasciola gigantica]
MKEYRREPAITFGDETNERVTRTQEVRKPLPGSQKSNSAASVNVIRPISLPDNGPPISNTSAKVALQLLITTIQDTVLSHERALRLIGSRMPLFDAMDDMKGWLKTKGKHAADEDYDWCRNRLNTLLNELEQIIRRAENALKEFHELRQLILRSVTGNSGDGITRTRLRPEQEAEMRRLLENTDRWFQQFPKNLPQGKQDEVMQPPLELFIAELQVIKATHDSIVAKSGSMMPRTKNGADFQLTKEVSQPQPAGSESQLMRTNNRRVSSQLSGNVRDTIPGSSDSKLPPTTLRMDSQVRYSENHIFIEFSQHSVGKENVDCSVYRLDSKQNYYDCSPLSGNVRDTIPGSSDSKLPPTTLRMDSQLTKDVRHPLPAGSEPQITQTKAWRVNSQPPKTRRGSISTTAEPEVSPPTARSSLHGSQTSVNETSTIINAEKVRLHFYDLMNKLFYNKQPH